MTAADIPPNRKHLAAMLRLFARTGAYFGHSARLELLEYIDIAEDTIAEQSKWLAEDAADMDQRTAARRVQGEVVFALGRECDRLKTQNASLRQLAEAALVAGQTFDVVSMTTIRLVLEKTS